MCSFTRVHFLLSNSKMCGCLVSLRQPSPLDTRIGTCVSTILRHHETDPGCGHGSGYPMRASASARGHLGSQSDAVVTSNAPTRHVAIQSETFTVLIGYAPVVYAVPAPVVDTFHSRPLSAMSLQYGEFWFMSCSVLFFGERQRISFAKDRQVGMCRRWMPGQHQHVFQNVGARDSHTLGSAYELWTLQQE